LDLSAYSPGSISLDIYGYQGCFAGTPTGFTPGTPYSLTFLNTAGGITGFDPPLFALSGAYAGQSSVSLSGSSLILNIQGSAVPEIDQAGMASVLDLVTGALGLLSAEANRTIATTRWEQVSTRSCSYRRFHGRLSSYAAPRQSAFPSPSLLSPRVHARAVC
jgi:hypothetical protein